MPFFVSGRRESAVLEQGPPSIRLTLAPFQVSVSSPEDQACQRQADSWRDSAEPRFAASDFVVTYRAQRFQVEQHMLSAYVGSVLRRPEFSVLSSCSGSCPCSTRRVRRARPTRLPDCRPLPLPVAG